MKFDPMIGKLLGYRILVKDRPTHAAHIADADEIRLPVLKAAETLFDCALKIIRRRAAVGRKIAEVILVQHHAAIFKTEMALKFGICRVCRRRFFQAHHFRQLFSYEIGIFDVAVVELQMHFNSLIGNSLESSDIEFLRAIGLSMHKFYSPYKFA